MIEPRLTSYSGHAYNYAASLKREIENKGGDFCILVSTDCDPNIISELNGIAVFSSNPSDKFFRSVFFRLFIVPFVFNWHLYKGLSLFHRKKSKQFDFFMGTTQYFDLLALFLFNFKVKRACNFFLTARMTNFRSDLDRWSITSYLYKFSLFFLFIQNVFKRNIHFITDSIKLKNEYEELSNYFRINVLPIPHTFPPNTKPTNSERSDSEIVVVSLGPARMQKGFLQIEKLIINYIKDKNNFAYNIVFHLQCSALQDQKTREAVSRLKSLKSENIILYEEELSENEYFNLLHKSDIVLLPYSRVSYFAQTSGVFTEAVSLGKIPIVNKGTWMSQELSNFNFASTCNTDSENEFFTLFQNICNDFCDYKISMKNISSRWNQFHNPKEFVKMLFKLVDE